MIKQDLVENPLKFKNWRMRGADMFVLLFSCLLNPVPVNRRMLLHLKETVVLNKTTFYLIFVFVCYVLI